MKKTTAILAGLLLLSISASANVVGKATAEKVAGRWFSSETKVLGWDGTVSSAETNSPVFYICNNPSGGWMILSAEDSTTPIIAYSETGSFDPEKLPSNARYWFGQYAKSIKELRRFDIKANAKVQQLWQTAGYRTKATGGKLLETANWDQDSPYNGECPKVTENGRTYNALTGCVATAMAIVIRYHQWPEHGTGTIGGYTYTTDYRQSMNIPAYSIDDHHYDYSLMPLKYSSSATSAQKAAVAQLMHDCGVSVEAMYNYGTGTGAYSENLVSALHRHMSYSGEAELLYRAEYSNAEWIRLIEKEIDENRPILYGGADGSEGGHQFVCDGYDSKDYIHINWGWSGSSNAYFTLDLNIPGSYTFSEGQDMVVGLTPDKTGTTTEHGGPLSLMSYPYGGYGSYKGITVISGDLPSKSFSLKIGPIYNDNWKYPYNGALRVARVNYKGELIEIVGEEKSFSVGNGELTVIDRWNCRVNTNYALGNAIIVQYKDYDGTWKKLRKQDEDGVLVDLIPYVDIPFIVLEDSYKAGDKIFFELALVSKPVKSIVWTLDGTTQKGVSAVLSAGYHTIVATVKYSDGITETITAQIEAK